MRTFQVTLSGKTPLLMHHDNIEWADFMDGWKNNPANKQGSKAGDDRSPAWRWLGCVYHDGKILSIPQSNIMKSFDASDFRAQEKGREVSTTPPSQNLRGGSKRPGVIKDEKVLAKAAIENLVVAALHVLDEDLTEEQRDLAEQIYGLANTLEYTVIL